MTFVGWRRSTSEVGRATPCAVAGASHLSFLDIPLLPRKADAMVTGMLAATTIGAERMWRIISDLVLAFFDKHLGDGEGEILDGLILHIPS